MWAAKRAVVTAGRAVVAAERAATKETVRALAKEIRSPPPPPQVRP